MLLWPWSPLALVLVTSGLLSQKTDAQGWVAGRLLKTEMALDEHSRVLEEDGGQTTRSAEEVDVLTTLAEGADVLAEVMDGSIVVVVVLKQLAQMVLRR